MLVLLLAVMRLVLLLAVMRWLWVACMAAVAPCHCAMSYLSGRLVRGATEQTRTCWTNQQVCRMSSASLCFIVQPVMALDAMQSTDGEGGSTLELPQGLPASLDGSHTGKEEEGGKMKKEEEGGRRRS